MTAKTLSGRYSNISQIVDLKGAPYTACHTEPLWVDTSQTNVFSVPTIGNKIEAFTTGKEYFDRLIQDCDSASSEIYIAGWQVNWDALLAKGVRLFDLLYRCAGRGVNIYVMPWNDTEPIQTYDDQTKVALESINALIAKNGGKGRVFVELSSSFAKINNKYFSHHQKQVVIDRKVGFVGGIDLAYGRLDDSQFELRADASGREMMNRYNPGIPSLKAYKSSDPALADPDFMNGTIDRINFDASSSDSGLGSNNDVHRTRVARGAWQVRYEKAGPLGTVPNHSSLAGNTSQLTTLDPSCQPRMPWQDVQSRIEGPAVSDLIRNFILRWNVVSRRRLTMPQPPSTYPKPGKAQIQVLRSAPAKQCADENKANNIPDSPSKQQDIHVAMKNLISKARHFIYIEQQFFVSDFGEIGGAKGASLSPAAQYIMDGAGGIGKSALKTLRALSHGGDDVMDRLPSNEILIALLARLKEIILDDREKQNFHIYITLPVHPEGALTEAAIAVQVYYTMQTLVFGSNSLLNGIKRLIKARELKDKSDPHFNRVIDNRSNSEHESVPDDRCFEYVTLLNLRNWGALKNRYVTEQIYVHSKLMIVDDRFVIVGSANINDRSLLGERDSELAVLVMDDDVKRANVNGDGFATPVRTFAHELRKRTWAKLFGITGNVRPANNLQSAIDSPGHPSSWQKIQAQAKANAAIYEAAFAHIPRNFTRDARGEPVNAAILPTWQNDDSMIEGGRLTSPMPCDSKFWQTQKLPALANSLLEQRGFITALPIHWTKGENIRIKYPTALIVRGDANEKTGGDRPGDRIVASYFKPTESDPGASA